jgi:hypothetical protein
MKLKLLQIILLTFIYLTNVQAATNFTKISTSPAERSLSFSELLNQFQDTLKKIVNSLFASFDHQKYSHFLQEFWSSLNQQGLATSIVYLTTYALSVIGFTVYWFPQLRDTDYWQPNQLRNLGRFGRSIDEMSTRVHQAIDQYSNAKPEVCLKMALCTLGKSKQHKRIPRSPTIDVINNILKYV